MGIFCAGFLDNGRSFLAGGKADSGSVTQERARPVYFFQYLFAGSVGRYLRGYSYPPLGKQQDHEIEILARHAVVLVVHT